MESSIQRALNDKLYDKRKVGALEYVYYLAAFISIIVSPLRGRVFISHRDTNPISYV